MRFLLIFTLFTSYALAAEKRNECELIDPTLAQELIKYEGPGCFIEKYWSSVESDLDTFDLRPGTKAYVSSMTGKHTPARALDFLQNKSLRFMNENQKNRGTYSPRSEVKKITENNYQYQHAGSETNVKIEKYGLFKRLRHELRPLNGLGSSHEFDVVCLESDFKSKCSLEVIPNEGIYDGERGFSKDLREKNPKLNKMSNSSQQ